MTKKIEVVNQVPVSEAKETKAEKLARLQAELYAAADEPDEETSDDEDDGTESPLLATVNARLDKIEAILKRHLGSVF